MRLSVSDWHPIQPYAVELASKLSAHGAATDAQTLSSRYTVALRGLGATGICTARPSFSRAFGIDAPSADLLSSTDGLLTIEQIMAAAWGERSEADRADLVDQVVHRFSQLESMGLVTFE